MIWFFFLVSNFKFCYIFPSEWWTYGIFLKSEKWEFIVLLNACIILAGEEAPGKWGLENTTLKQTWALHIHLLCVGFQVRPFNQWPHAEDIWSPGSRSNPLERWDASSCFRNIMNRHATGPRWVAFKNSHDWTIFTGAGLMLQIGSA